MTCTSRSVDAPILEPGVSELVVQRYSLGSGTRAREALSSECRLIQHKGELTCLRRPQIYLFHASFIGKDTFAVVSKMIIRYSSITPSSDSERLYNINQHDCPLRYHPIHYSVQPRNTTKGIRYIHRISRNRTKPNPWYHATQSWSKQSGIINKRPSHERIEGTSQREK